MSQSEFFFLRNVEHEIIEVLELVQKRGKSN